MSKTNLLEEKINKKTKWGRKAKKVLNRYRNGQNTARLSLLTGLASYFPERDLKDILENAEIVDYQEGVKGGKCVCGHSLKNVYRMRIKGAKKGGAESNIYSKKKVPVSRARRGKQVEFTLGSECYKHLPDMLSDLDIMGLRRQIKDGKEKAEKGLEKLVSSKKIRERLGISAEDFAYIADIVKDLEKTEEGLLYALDPGRKNSFLNWFKNGIDSGEIKDKKIKNTYTRLEKTPFLVKPAELAELTTFEYEHRKHPTKAVLGGVKDDLSYLAGEGKVNIDKRYVKPKTKLSKRRKAEKVTIREKMEQTHLTFLEALGVRKHFPDIEERRIEANREFSQRYAKGRGMDYLLQEVKDVVEEVNTELKAEYKAFGKNTNEHKLSKKELKAAKSFLNRAKLGKGSERDNYLKMFSIPEFREVLPTIVAIGRKERFAESEYSEESDKLDFMGQACALREDLADISEKVYKVSRTVLLDNQKAVAFQEKNGRLIQDMYENGLVAKKYIKPTGKDKKSAIDRYVDMVDKEGAVEIDPETAEKIEKIQEMAKLPFFEYSGRLADIELKDASYITEEGKELVESTFEDLDYILGKLDLTGDDEGRFERAKKEFEKGTTKYIDGNDFYFASSITLGLEGVKVKKGEISAYNPREMEVAANKVQAGIIVDDNFIDRLYEVTGPNARAVLGIDKNVSLWFNKMKEADRVVVESKLKDKVDRLYIQLQLYSEKGEQEVSAKVRNALWEKATDRRGKKRLENDLSESIYHKLVTKDDDLREVLNGTTDGYINYKNNKDGEFERRSNPRYRSEEPNQKFAYLNFLRFMGDGKGKVEWQELASGKQKSFAIHSRIREYLKDDLENGILDKDKFKEYSRRMDQFEESVNGLLKEKYGFRKS